MDIVTAPPNETSAAVHFLLSLVPQMERLTTRNQTKAKISFLQVFDDLETSQERHIPYAVTPQPYERHWQDTHLWPTNPMGLWEGHPQRRIHIMSDCERATAPHGIIFILFFKKKFH